MKERLFNANTITCLLYLVSLCSGISYTVVPGEKYLGSVVKLFETIGQQQWVRECRHIPKLCRGVNFRKQELLCELVSAIDEREINLDYVKIEVNQVNLVLFLHLKLSLILSVCLSVSRVSQRRDGTKN